jgi:type I restriction enzyme S subunit
MSDLRPGWDIASVGEVTSEVRSGFASGKHNATGAGIPHLRPMNVSRLGEIDMVDVKYVDPSVDDRRLEPGDILFNNTNSPVLVGKTALVRQIRGEAAFSNHMTRLRAIPGLDPAFLAFQLHFLWMTGRLSHLITNHVNQASISAKVLAERVQVAVPPAAEQERIVTAIEEQLSRLGAAESATASARRRLAGFYGVAGHVRSRVAAGAARLAQRTGAADLLRHPQAENPGARDSAVRRGQEYCEGPDQGG